MVYAQRYLWISAEKTATLRPESEFDRQELTPWLNELFDCIRNQVCSTNLEWPFCCWYPTFFAVRPLRVRTPSIYRAVEFLGWFKWYPFSWLGHSVVLLVADEYILKFKMAFWLKNMDCLIPMLLICLSDVVNRDWSLRQGLHVYEYKPVKNYSCL